MKNQSKIKKFNQQIKSTRRHEPRRKFACACCEYVIPVRFGRVLTISSGNKLEICDDCFGSSDHIYDGYCKNCHALIQDGFKLKSTEDNELRLCRKCATSGQGINDYYDN
ncbi:hypothetical protein IHC87_06675 [Photobacterium damselae subsp. damselae]|uniref:hypothetical protein n=1 Tax=Photobacterium damselae TaxID=38293 RepID=UPI001F1B158E|nr:hypothetical protein [Photobacterium damselae]UJZ95024.1 hypothetical protein IHC87_06675 [Photobacterium damselae subsp. damselae]UJZ99005.1 hypothetical protein IHC88_06665 [Photobacterium damselae subsp. damselae]